MSSQVQPASGYIPSYNVFRLISPQVAVDAHASTGTVTANATFNTNLPLGKAMAITAVDWFVNATNASAWVLGHAGSQPGNSLLIGQLTEALARLLPALNDPTYVSDYLDEFDMSQDQNTPGAVFSFMNRLKAHWQDRPRYPWLSVAQQLNLIGQYVGNGQQNGLHWNFQVIVQFELIDITPQVNTYLSTRLQITGQA